jgi:hypothetical protein
MTRILKEILCRFGLHYWKYVTKTKQSIWLKGVHRICRHCKLEQSHFYNDGWDIDFDE